MSLLMPEYERQIRATARRLARDTGLKATKPSQFGARLVLVASGVVALAVAATAVVLLGHRGAPDLTAGSALPAVQYACAPKEVIRPKGRLVAVARGTIGGRRWTLEADSRRHGVSRVQAGQLLLGGHAYGFCKTPLDIELVNSGPHGVVYGLATGRYRPPITIEATTAHGTAKHPVPAHSYPAITRHVSSATLFLRALPASACAYRQLAVTAPMAARVSRRNDRTSEGKSVSHTFLGMTATFARACAPGQLRQTPR